MKSSSGFGSSKRRASHDYFLHVSRTYPHHVHKSAEAYAHHGGKRERRALKALHRLDRQARHFHEQVERYYQDPYHTEEDYRRLMRAYHEARRAMRGLHAFEHIYDDFYHVEELIHELAYYYEERDHYRGHDDEHGYDERRHYRRPYRARLGVSFRWRR